MPLFSRSNQVAFAGLLLVASTLLAPVAQAQLYSWKDAEGNVIIKNAPPPWYKEGEPSRGPRVQVMRMGKIIDDTAWPLERRQEGRAQAARQEAEQPPTPAKAPAAPVVLEGQMPLPPAAGRALQPLQAIQKQN